MAVLAVQETREAVLRWRVESGSLYSLWRNAQGQAAVVGPQLSRAASREPFAFLRCQRRWRARPLASVPRDLPAIAATTNGAYQPAPDWYRNFCYTREREHGMDFTEDLASPRVFSFDLAHQEAVMILHAVFEHDPPREANVVEQAAQLTLKESERRAEFETRLGVRQMRILSIATWEIRSSQAFRGSPTGAAIPSFRCAACRSR